MKKKFESPELKAAEFVVAARLAVSGGGDPTPPPVAKNKNTAPPGCAMQNSQQCDIV